MKLAGDPQREDPGVELLHWCPGNSVAIGFGPGAPGEWWVVFQIGEAGDVWWLLEGSEVEMLAWFEEMIRCWGLSRTHMAPSANCELRNATA